MHRLVLFDIDSTLIDARGAGGRALLPAIADVYGVTGTLDGYSFEGRTDPQIVREIATRWGVAPDAVDPLLGPCLCRYLDRLEDVMAGWRVVVLPGVRELLTALVADRRVTVGLQTGNVEHGARLKLGSSGLWDLFPFGTFGSDAEGRPDLATIAVERARAHAGIAFTGREVVIVGDTPADVTCGAHLDVATIAVTTGRHPRAELAAAGADHILPDLSEWRRIHGIIVDGSHGAGRAGRLGERRSGG